MEGLKEATMLFRPGTSEVVWGIPVDTITVDAHEVEDYLADGWYDHPWKARDAAEAGKHPAKTADELRQDGPTIAEYVAAGYHAASYPPAGYASRSTEEEIAAAIAAQETGSGEQTEDQGQPEPPTLEQRAKAVGVTIDKRWSPETAEKKVAEAEEAAKGKE